MLWLSLAGALFRVWLVLVFLFTPAIDSHLSRRTSVHDDAFLYTIQSTCQAALHQGNRVSVLTNGARFYPAMLDAIRCASRSINMYRKAMTHAKVLLVDGVWPVIGTTNIDNRSFEHNDEVNVAMLDRLVAERVLEDYERDIADSDEITLARWRRRPLWERVVGPFVWILERQQ